MFKLPKERRGIFVVGLVLTVGFSLLIGYLHVGVLFLLGTPLLGVIAGLTLVWFSRIARSSKLLISFLPIPLIIGSLFLFLYLMTAEGENFIVPEDYQGEIVVFYDEVCGEPAVYENGRRIYNIRADGILITQATKNDGYHDRKFFLRREDGMLKEIPSFGRQNFETEKREWGTYTSVSKEELTFDTVGVFWSYGRGTYYASSNSIGYIIASYRWFDQDEKERYQSQKEFAERARNLLNECRRHF